MRRRKNNQIQIRVNPRSVVGKLWSDICEKASISVFCAGKLSPSSRPWHATPEALRRRVPHVPYVPKVKIHAQRTWPCSESPILHRSQTNYGGHRRAAKMEGRVSCHAVLSLVARRAKWEVSLRRRVPDNRQNFILPHYSGGIKFRHGRIEFDPPSRINLQANPEGALIPPIRLRSYGGTGRTGFSEFK